MEEALSSYVHKQSTVEGQKSPLQKKKGVFQVGSVVLSAFILSFFLFTRGLDQGLDYRLEHSCLLLQGFLFFNPSFASGLVFWVWRGGCLFFFKFALYVLCFELLY